LDKMLSKLEVDILIQMKNDGILDCMNSRSIKNISKKIDVNYYRVRLHIGNLYKLGYISMGFRERSSNTYFLTSKGVEIIETKT